MFAEWVSMGTLDVCCITRLNLSKLMGLGGFTGDTDNVTIIIITDNVTIIITGDTDNVTKI